MHELESEVEAELTSVIATGNLARAESLVSQRLAALSASPFHVALDLRITNCPTDVAEHFDAFFERESERFQIACAYAEMNDFGINPEAWFFDVFAYARYGGPGNDNHWLADWHSEPHSSMLITGLEGLQQVYASDAWHDRAFTDAADLAGLLVIVRFQDLIRRSSQHMRLLTFPLLASAHDELLLYEFHPTAEQGAAPNGGPATPSGGSGVTEGPPSAS